MDDGAEPRPDAAHPNAGRPTPDRPARPRSPAADGPRPRAARLDAGALVAALWRAHPPDEWVSGRPWPVGGPSGRDALAELATRADRLAARGGPAAPAARLLGDTARTVAAVLASDGAPAVPTANGALASPARLRLARMERWLAARAAADPAAEPAADLCLWAVEHLEAGGG